jgi:hypothetical protein
MVVGLRGRLPAVAVLRAAGEESFRRPEGRRGNKSRMPG